MDFIGWPDEGPPPVSLFLQFILMHAQQTDVRMQGSSQVCKEIPKKLEPHPACSVSTGPAFWGLVIGKKKKIEVKEVKKEDRKKQTFRIFATHVNWSWWPK